MSQRKQDDRLFHGQATTKLPKVLCARDNECPVECWLENASATASDKVFAAAEMHCSIGTALSKTLGATQGSYLWDRAAAADTASLDSVHHPCSFSISSSSAVRPSSMPSMSLNSASDSVLLQHTNVAITTRPIHIECYVSRTTWPIPLLQLTCRIVTVKHRSVSHCSL